MSRLLPRNWTIRGRLTALYGGLFFVAGAILLALVYLLVWQILNRSGVDGATAEALRSLGAVEPAENRGQLATTLQQAQLQQREDILNSLLHRGAIALAVTGLIAAVLGWLLARRALHPVHQITETANRIASTDAHRALHERIVHTGPRDEVAELARTFNTMLARLDHSFDSQQRFIANASHEMRTPLAIKRALIEITVTRQGTSDDAVRLGESLLEINARHERLIDGLLTLAASENEPAERTPVDLADIASHVVEQLALGLVEVRRAPLSPAPALGDPVMLERLVQNLVENAVRHNVENGWIEVRTGTEAGGSTVTISNSGPVVRPYEVETLFQPFRRLSRERTSGERGFGLGLSIARAVSHAHQGDLTVTPRPDGGLVVTLRLPDPGRG